jgi:hypothetical protein
MNSEEKCNRIVSILVLKDGKRIPHRTYWDDDLVGPESDPFWAGARRAIKTEEVQVVPTLTGDSLEITPVYKKRLPPINREPLTIGEMIVTKPSLLVVYPMLLLVIVVGGAGVLGILKAIFG